MALKTGQEDWNKDSKQKPAILFVAGFGDGAEMFDRLAKTELADHYRLAPIDLPGFAGAEPLSGGTTLEALADVVHQVALQKSARIIAAHSVASIIASLAARREGSPINTIISLEGNLTAQDAYFSGTAADYPNPELFREAFLARLDEMVETQSIIARYRKIAAKADPKALWELGCDARRFSESCEPGDVLSETENVIYLYNPENCSNSSLEWLRTNSMRQIRMEGASHWPSVDQPETLSAKILEALSSK